MKRKSKEVKEDEVCWICYDGLAAEPLIHPCPCTGTCGSVHRTCLTTWIANSSQFCCPQCRTDYEMEPLPGSTWNAWRMGWMCAGMALGESILAFVIAHAPLLLFVPLAYSFQSPTVNEETKLATAFLLGYGGELVLILISLIVVAVMANRDVHGPNCQCHSCRRGSRSFFSDFPNFVYIHNRPSSSGSSSSPKSGGGGGSGKGDGIPILILILLVLVLVVFYALFLGLIIFIVQRHVRTFYAQRKMEVYTIRSIRVE